MSTHYSSMSVQALKKMYDDFLSLTADQRYNLAKSADIIDQYEDASREFQQYLPITQAFVLTHRECGGFGKDFNSCARTMLYGQPAARKRLKRNLDRLKANPSLASQMDMAYKNLNDKGILMLSLLWPCTLHGGRAYWELECRRIGHMMDYKNMAPGMAEAYAPPPPTREDPTERAAAPTTTARVQNAPSPPNQPSTAEDIPMPPATTPTTPPEEPIRPLFVILSHCQKDKQLQSVVRELCKMSKEDKAILLALLNALPT